MPKMTIIYLNNLDTIQRRCLQVDSCGISLKEFQCTLLYSIPYPDTTCVWIPILLEEETL